MVSKATSVRLDSETLSRLDVIAKATDRSRAWLMSQAIRRYVEEELWVVQAVEEGIKDADEGRTVSDKKVGDWIESIGTDHELEPPRCD